MHWAMDSVFQVVGGRSFQIVAGAIISFAAILVLLYRALFVIRYPRNLARLGEQEGIPWLEMKKKFETNALPLLNDVYENYSKKGRTVLIPMFGPHEGIILPASSLQWLCRQPDDVLSTHAAQIDAIQLDNSLGHKFAHDAWGGIMIKTDLNSVLEPLCNLMNDEVAAVLSDTFGKDSENWKELDLFPACRTLAGRAVLRFTLGDSPEGRRLSKDEGFLQSCFNVLDGMLETAGTMGAARKAFRPFLGRWASRAMPAKLKDLKQRFEPLYRERMQLLEQRAASKEAAVPQDLLQMMLDYAIKERPDEAYSLDDMTKRLAVLNFGTMHQTVITLHNIFLDMLDSNSEFDTISVIRDEVVRVIGDSPDTHTKNWTRAKVLAMTKADSMARETLRVHTFLGCAMERLVVAREGLVTEDGIRLPRGSKVSILAHQAQTDGELFKDPLKYDPFRTSRAREAAADPSTGRPGLNNLSFVSTSSEFLPFNHGKHACPGRGLVDFQFKMTLAYTVMNYDLDFPESYGGKRPENTWFGSFGVPPLTAKIRVRRKKDT
ncbi:cytochrome P450 [Phlyctema vagabunda]|uniref:Cytochrome P450 n=1 Tax=Phlyctema vagabunda TaxID=108571 RepID=A0ABR4PEJ3_9HELO